MAIQSVKLFANDEIRRFPVADGHLKYETLVQKVAQLYPNCSMIQMAWKDIDNDLVVIKTDDDLNEAVKCVSNGVLHIFLQFDAKMETSSNDQDTKIGADQAYEQPGSNQTESERGSTLPKPDQDPSLHVGITCDSCNGVVIGLRYKCLTCPNFDLCETCESAHYHDDHPMIRIVAPNDKSWEKAFFAAQFPFHPRHFYGHRRAHGSPPSGPNKQRCRARNCDESDRNETREEEMSANHENVQNVGEMIANVLSALGIDLQAKSADKAENQQKDFTTEQPTCSKKAQNEDDPMAKIQKAFDQMLSMGFNNEDGWLKNLLQQKNGDVNAVLDLFNHGKH